MTIDRIRLTFSLAFMLGWQDVRQAYRRSSFGPFWITAGMTVQILTIAFVFGMIFKTDMQEFLPFIASSIIFWSLISATISDGCMSFIGGEAIIKQLNIPLLTHVLRVIWRNLINFAHNVVILPLAFVVVLHGLNWNAVLAIPGIVLLIINLGWIALVLAFLSARFRDMPPIVSSLLMIALYLTPVMWYPSLIGNNELAHFLLGLNPFYHLLQIVRSPLLGEVPTVENWSLSVLLATVGWSIAALVFSRFRTAIAYWV